MRYMVFMLLLIMLISVVIGCSVQTSQGNNFKDINIVENDSNPKKEFVDYLNEDKEIRIEFLNIKAGQYYTEEKHKIEDFELIEDKLRDIESKSSAIRNENAGNEEIANLELKFLTAVQKELEAVRIMNRLIPVVNGEKEMTEEEFSEKAEKMGELTLESKNILMNEYFFELDRLKAKYKVEAI